MSERLKLILKIIGFVFLVFVFAWAIWFFFFRSQGDSYFPGISKQEQQVGLPKTKEGTGGNIVEQGALALKPEEDASSYFDNASLVASGGRTSAKAVTNSRSDFAYLADGGDYNYYNSSDGKFYSIGKGGLISELSSEKFWNVSNTYWSRNGKSAVLEFPDGSNIYYDFKTGKRATLPKEAREFSFSNDDSFLAYEYIGESPDDRWIIVSSPDGQGQVAVQEIADESKNVKVDWSPTGSVVATFRKPTSALGEEVFFIGLNGENYLSLQTNGLGFQGKWSPKGKQILYSVFNSGSGYNPVLHIAGAEGDNIGLGNRSLNISTWPDKCVFENEDTVYCAVPYSLEEGSGIFRERASHTSDAIYKVDLKNNISSVLALPESGSNQSFTIESVSVSEDGKLLYFTDRVNGYIYSINLR